VDFTERIVRGENLASMCKEMICNMILDGMEAMAEDALAGEIELQTVRDRVVTQQGHGGRENGTAVKGQCRIAIREGG